MEQESVIRRRFELLRPVLDERTRRLFLGVEAKMIGRGGVSLVSRATGVSRAAVTAGKLELEFGNPEKQSATPERIRKEGGGRKRTVETDSTLLKDLEELVEPDARGDPESPLRWTCKSLRTLAAELTRMGHRTSHRMVGELLRELGYSLQANRKTLEGADHPDRNAQFQHINQRCATGLKSGRPAISVDTKKKELVGDFKTAGRQYRPKGQPCEVRVHDFMIKELGKANPCGVYDIGHNLGWVNVGTDHDTGAFAVESIRRWWKTMGSRLYHQPDEILIVADGGGSNGSRLRLWKVELQKLADELGLRIGVSHLPPGTSKWNKIEHRLFSFITMNWRGQPLVTHEVIVNLIRSTTTETGLRVECELDTDLYPAGLKISDEEMAQLNIVRDEFHGEWNYTIHPRQQQLDL